MFKKAKIKNKGKNQNSIPMFKKAKTEVSKSQNPDFQCLEKPKINNSHVRNSRGSHFQCLEKPNFTISVFGIAKIRNSNAWNSENS